MHAPQYGIPKDAPIRPGDRARCECGYEGRAYAELDGGVVCSHCGRGDELVKIRFRDDTRARRST